MSWRGVGTERGHSFFSPELKESSEVMTLYYDTKENMTRHVVSWLTLGSHEGIGRRCRMKSFQFGGESLFDIVSALAP
jgi:hypothetical protein